MSSSSTTTTTTKTTTGPPTICLRLKRANQTYFITTEKKNSILSLKEEISKALNRSIPPNKIRIALPDTEDDINTNSNSYTKLPDTALLSDHPRIQDDSILYVIFRKKGMEDTPGEDEFGELDNVWETVNIIQPEES